MLSPDTIAPTEPPVGQVPQEVTPQKPVRPEVPAKLREFADKWWKTTKDLPDRDAAVCAATESQKTLFPAWFDRTDRHRGNIPSEIRSRKDDRRVRVQIAYRNVLQTVAMTVPDDHDIRWRPLPQVGSENIDLPTLKPHVQLADTLTCLVKHYVGEANFQETVQAWVQDAAQYRLSILKVVFDRDFAKDSVRAHGENKDQQDNLARLRVLVEGFAFKNFDENSAEFSEMESLKVNLGIESELKMWAGIRAEVVPIDSFGFDPAVRGLENIYQASWMYHDVMLSKDEILAKFPYTPDPVDQTKWTGVHQDDLTDGKKNSSLTGFNWTSTGSSLGKGPTPNADSKSESDRFKVREVWVRSLNEVVTLIEGVEYPVSRWTPTASPSQWYPFRLLRMNRVTGQVYGYSDVELMSEIQHRINRKRSDEEKARWLHLPRGIYNTQGIDQTEIGKMRDHVPGEWKGINLGGAKSIKEVLEYHQSDFTPASFDTQKDEVDMSMMAGLPAQMLGTTGQAKFSSEVQTASQGAAVNAGARASIIRRSLEGTYDLIAELLLQNLTGEEVVSVAGPLAFWPKVHSMVEANQLKKNVEEQSKQEIQQQVMMQTMQGVPVPDAVTLEIAVKNLIAQKNISTFGWPEPVSREVIFSRLSCSVTVALNTQADRQQRINGIQSLSSSIQMLAQAAMSAGKVLNLKPLLKSVQPIFGADIDLVDMFQDPPMPMQVGGPQGGQPGLPPDAAGKMAPQSGSDDRKAGVGVPPMQPG